MYSQSKVDSLGHGYPRPQLERNEWLSLNGRWKFFIDSEAALSHPRQVDFNSEITVPYAPECTASGIANTDFYRAVWYQREFTVPKLKSGKRLVLHFGAVDWNARVWVNGQLAVEHDGGYTPFFADITDLLKAGREQTLVVRAYDNPHDLEKNRGKQDWERKEHGIWYPRTTGIWQTVWAEVVNATRLSRLDWHPSIHDWSVGFTADIEGACTQATSLSVTLKCGDELLAENNYAFTAGDCKIGRIQRTIELVDVKQRLELPDGAIDQIRRDLLWHPDRPNIIDALVELRGAGGAVLDSCNSYTQLTSVTTSDRRLVFNERDEELRLALDQGYWPDSGMTPPDDEAIKRDVLLLKQAGFNGVRKHNKLEDPRFLYWADMLGLFVWEELPSAYRFTSKAIERSTRTWVEAIERDRNHRCIIAWVPVNESWGVPQLTEDSLQRTFLRSMYTLTKILTNGGIVVGNDGWEMVASDIVAIHDYDADTDRIARRYEDSEANLERLFRDERPGGRVLLLEDMDHRNKPKMLTEFGGIKLSKEEGSWGYSVAVSAEDLAERYQKLLSTVRSLPLLGGFCYTEFTDVYQEANGLFWMDRTPKFPIEAMFKANAGPL